MTSSDKLYARIVKYLGDSPGVWKTKKDIYDRARAKGYSYDCIQEACRKLDETTNIGMKYEEGVWYCYYTMTDKEMAHVERGLKEFDALPDKE